MNDKFSNIISRKGSVYKILVAVAVLFMGNLNALIDSVIHPEIPYFDHEHLIAGGAAAFMTGLLFFLIMLADKKIIKSNNEWVWTFDAMPDLIALIDDSYRIIRINKALADKTGATKDVEGAYCYRHICGSDKPPPDCPHTMLMSDGLAHSAEMHLARLGGDYLVSSSPLSDAEGTLIGSVHALRDITEQKRDEDALRQSEMRFRSLVEQSLVGIYVIRDGNFIYANPKLVEITGYTQDELIFSKSALDLIAPESRAKIAEKIGKLIAGEAKTVHDTFKGLRKDGSVIDVEAYGTIMEIDGKPAIIGTLLDITEKKKIEDEREEARRFLQSVIDGVRDSILVIGADYKVQMMNKTAREQALRETASPDPLFCYQILHRKDKPCDGDELPCSLKIVMRTKQACVINHIHINKDNTARNFEILASPVFDKAGNVVRIIESCRDVTEKLLLEKARKKTDVRLFQQQKEHAIVTLAGGIAHDFNNILMGVLGYAEMLKSMLPPHGKELELSDIIINSSQRMAHLTRQLLAYAKKGDYEQKIISLNDSVREALILTHKDQAKEIEAVLNLSEDLWPVFADPGQILQVMINLFTNAFEAMAEGGGRLTIRTVNIKNKSAWECPLERHHPAGDYVSMSVADTGPGIPLDLQKNIFEPFYTTKFLGRGLGLSAALGIIQNHNGCISVESPPGKGATIHVFLPRFEDKER